MAHQHGFGDHFRRNALLGASAVIDRSTKHDQFVLFPDAPNVKNPGFFQGLAGIGYELLRLSHPELPSILMFE